LIQNPAYGPVVFSLLFAKAHLFFGADVLFCIFLYKKAHYLPKVNTQTDNLAKRTRTVAENG